VGTSSMAAEPSLCLIRNLPDKEEVGNVPHPCHSDAQHAQTRGHPRAVQMAAGVVTRRFQQIAKRSPKQQITRSTVIDD
jgi:hypothetical protein